MIYNLIKNNLITWIALTGLWMLLDFIEVKIVRINGYVYVGLIILALIAFFLTTFNQLSKRTKEERYRFSFVTSIALAGAWLIFGMVFILIFHGLIGGSE
jgi:NADH:ubiquinone oxidoreductase subunit 6 (subunit J)